MPLTPYQRARQVALDCLDRTYDNNGPDATYEDFMADLAREAGCELPDGEKRAELAASLLAWWDRLSPKEQALTEVGASNLDD